MLWEWFHPDARRVRQRMAEEFGKELGPVSESGVFKNLDKLVFDPGAASASAEAAVLSIQAPRGLRARLSDLLDKGNAGLAPEQFAVIAAVLGGMAGVTGFWFGGVALAIPAALAAALTPLIVVHVRAKARQQKYLRQLPNAFELMARVIRAGQSVPQALQAVADAFEDPLAGEFANCQKQQNLGLRPEVTFQEMAQRSGILEMRIFAMAMLIQRQTGGNLSDVLERLATLVRSRLRLKQQVRSLTAEGRMQGWTLVVLPFVVFAAMMVINRSYAEILLDHVPLLAVTLGMMAAGLLWIRKIANFET